MNFLSQLTGSFALQAAGNPTVAMIEAAYRHHGLDWRYVNCEVPPAALGDAVRGARAMGWAGFNCSLPHKVAVIGHLDGLGESAAIMGAVAGRARVEFSLELPFVQMRRVGKLPTMVAKFTTDIPSLTTWGEPFLLGPGSIHVAHTPFEKVAKKELLEAVEMYVELARELVKGSTG